MRQLRAAGTKGHAQRRTTEHSNLHTHLIHDPSSSSRPLDLAQTKQPHPPTCVPRQMARPRSRVSSVSRYGSKGSAVAGFVRVTTPSVY